MIEDMAPRDPQNDQCGSRDAAVTPATAALAKGKSLGEKLNAAVQLVTSQPVDWPVVPNQASFFEHVALAFAASLTHDETASAVIAAQAEEISRLRTASDARYLKGLEAAARATSAEAKVTALTEEVRAQAETINELAVALQGLRGWMPASGQDPVIDDAMRAADAALSKPRPDTGEQSQ